MTIGANQIVSVPPRVINAGGTDLEISGLFLTENALCPFPGTNAYTSANAVGQYYGFESAEYNAAQKYFLGYDNSFAKPRRVHFARLVTSAIAGSLIGGTAASMDELKAVTAGAMDISIDGAVKNVTTLSLAECNTQSDVAVAVQNVLTGTTVQYNSNLGAFIVTSSTTGDTSAIGVAEDVAEGQNLATLLGLTAEAGATESKGSNALTPNANMSSITNITQNWVSFTTLEEQDDDVVLGLAEWTNDSNGEYLYVPYTTVEGDVNPSGSGTLTKQLANLNPEGVVLVYGKLEHAILPMAVFASIDWNRNNALVTCAGKSQSGLEAFVTDDTTAANCVEQNVNFYGKYATRNDQFILFYQGAMIGGRFGFADAYVGNLWLRNALQVAIMNGFSQIGRAGYSTPGYTTIRAWCQDPINRAIRNGVIAPGVELSEAQKAQLFSEIGQNVADQIFTDGYYLQVEDPGAQARANRESPTMGVWYTYDGAVHSFNVPVTAVL